MLIWIYIPVHPNQHEFHYYGHVLESRIFEVVNLGLVMLVAGYQHAVLSQTWPVTGALHFSRGSQTERARLSN